jgi:hypothetical protein
MDSPYFEFFDDSQSPDPVSPRDTNYTPAFEPVTGSAHNNEFGAEADANLSTNIFHHPAFEEAVRQVLLDPQSLHNPLIPIETGAPFHRLINVTGDSTWEGVLLALSFMPRISMKMIPLSSLSSCM